MKYLNSQIKFVEQESEFLASQNNETYIIVLDQTEVIYGKDDSCNIEYCIEHNIPYAHQKILQRGGCIVGVKGNLFIDAKCPNGGEAISDKFAKALSEYFKSKNLPSVRCDNNDVLVDGFKVASGCQSEVQGFQYMGYQISINQDIETIKAVCNKSMEKIPKGLRDYGITTNEMIEFCKKYFNNN